MKRLVSFLLVIVLTIMPMITFVPTMEADAATVYDFLWPVENGEVSQYFKGSDVHGGIDIVSSGNDTIYAACSGKVIRAHNPCQHVDDYYLTECTHYSTYGNSIAIQHDDGTIAYYGHLKYNSLQVSVGDKVEAGQAIAMMGSSGKSTGKHLHFDLRLSDGTKVNVNPISKDGSINYRYTGYQNISIYEVAYFPMDYLNISQGVNGSYSHKGTNAIDLPGKDTGKDVVYAPFTGVIKRIYTDNGNFIWLESCNPVIYADGTIDYMTVMMGHDNDVSDLYVGKIINQGEIFYSEGTAGNATGNHIHLECGRGRFQSIGWYKNSDGKWMIYNSILPYDALVIKDSVIVINDYGYNWRNESSSGTTQPTIVPATIEDGDYYIKNGDYYLQITKDIETWELASAAGSVVPSTTNKSYFTFEKDEDYYKIAPTESQYDNALNVLWDVSPYDYIVEGNEVSIWKSSGSNSQRWILEAKDGGYIIHTVDHPGWVITRVSDNKLEIKTYTGADNQIWQLIPKDCSHTYNDDYSSNSSGHWRACTLCGNESTVIPHVYTYACDNTCNDCGYVRDASHTYTTGYASDEAGHWKSCTICDEKTAHSSHTPGAAATETTPQLCTECGYVIQAPIGHEHHYDTEYKSNDQQHWHECTSSDCSAKTEVEDHIFSNPCNSSCEKCGYELSREHAYDNDCDAACNRCGEIRKTEHSYDNGTIITEPTETTTGEKLYVCTECGFEKREVLGILGNDEGPTTEEPATKGPCYIATSVYGSYDCPEVWTLRRFRDNTLASTWWGRAFIKVYYTVSPTLVEWFGDTQWFQNTWRGVLDFFVGVLNGKGVEDTPYDDIDWQ